MGSTVGVRYYMENVESHKKLIQVNKKQNITRARRNRLLRNRSRCETRMCTITNTLLNIRQQVSERNKRKWNRNQSEE